MPTITDRNRQLLELTPLGRAVLGLAGVAPDYAGRPVAVAAFAWDESLRQRDEQGRWCAGLAVTPGTTLTSPAEKTEDGRALAQLVGEVVGVTRNGQRVARRDITGHLEVPGHHAQADTDTLAITADKLQDMGLPATAAAIQACLAHDPTADQGAPATLGVPAPATDALNRLLRAAHAELARHGVAAGTTMGLYRESIDMHRCNVGVADQGTGEALDSTPRSGLLRLRARRWDNYGSKHTELGSLSPAALAMLALHKATTVADPDEVVETPQHRGLLRGLADTHGSGDTLNTRSLAALADATSHPEMQTSQLGGPVDGADDPPRHDAASGDLLWPFRINDHMNGRPGVPLVRGQLRQDAQGNETLDLGPGVVTAPGTGGLGLAHDYGPERFQALVGWAAAQAALRGAKTLSFMVPVGLDIDGYSSRLRRLRGAGLLTTEEVATPLGRRTRYTLLAPAAAAGQLIDTAWGGHGLVARYMTSLAIHEDVSPGPAADVRYSTHYSHDPKKHGTIFGRLQADLGAKTATLALTPPPARTPESRRAVLVTTARALQEAHLRGLESVTVTGKFSAHFKAAMKMLADTGRATKVKGGYRIDKLANSAHVLVNRSSTGNN